MDPLRQHLLAQLQGGLAYDTFGSIVAEFSEEERFTVPEGAEHSAWQILDHMRIALRDILDFCKNEDGSYVEKEWPAGYWREQPAVRGGAWEDALRGYRADLEEMEQLVADSSRDLFKPFPWGEGQTLLREALLVSDHAAYHLGQLVELKRMVSART